MAYRSAEYHAFTAIANNAHVVRHNPFNALTPDDSAGMGAINRNDCVMCPSCGRTAFRADVHCGTITLECIDCLNCWDIDNDPTTGFKR